MPAHYPCCQHCIDFGRKLNPLSPDSKTETDHENHEAACYSHGCPGGWPKR